MAAPAQPSNSNGASTLSAGCENLILKLIAFHHHFRAPVGGLAGAAGADPGRREFSDMLMNAHIASHMFGA